MFPTITIFNITTLFQMRRLKLKMNSVEYLLTFSFRFLRCSSSYSSCSRLNRSSSSSNCFRCCFFRRRRSSSSSANAIASSSRSLLLLLCFVFDFYDEKHQSMLCTLFPQRKNVHLDVAKKILVDHQNSIHNLSIFVDVFHRDHHPERQIDCSSNETFIMFDILCSNACFYSNLDSRRKSIQ